MTVSFVLIKGRRAPDRIANKILTRVYPHLATNSQVLAKKLLHFTDMNTITQNVTATHLADELIVAIVVTHWHTQVHHNHRNNFETYLKMVQKALMIALAVTPEDIQIIIAEQGNSDSYRAELVSVLKTAVQLYRKRSGKYRKVAVELCPAKTSRGLQIADFYAGAVRKMWLECSRGAELQSCSPFRFVQHQIELEQH